MIPIRDLMEASGPIGADMAEVELGGGQRAEVYPRSTHRVGEDAVFVARQATTKGVFVASSGTSGPAWQSLQGEVVECGDRVRLKRCSMDHANATAVRELFPFARPALIGTEDSFGFGDRLGVANPAHLRAVTGTGFRAVLAQQSIRELERTGRTAGEVMDAATWAVLQEGFHDGFGADADHLKQNEHIDRMVAAGFTMFTIDPGDHVVDDADSLPSAEVEQIAADLPWDRLEDTLQDFVARYAGRPFVLPGGVALEAGREEVVRALVKYGRALAHTSAMYRHLVSRVPADQCELEVSVDETEAVTSAFEHLLFANELQRLGVRWVSLAPRFVGAFEKGVDFRGDLDELRRTYLTHLTIAEAYGGYKISIHSGSDKFSVYGVIGALGRGRVHVKTAGTSYLEALRTAAACEPELFRDILDFARDCYEEERRTYHVSAVLAEVPPAARLGDLELAGLLDQDDARQVLHVTFGRVLTECDDDGRPRFKIRLLRCLERNEETHDGFVEQHFRRHLRPFVVPLPPAALGGGSRD